MSRENILAIALGGLALGSAPLSVHAQSGDALARAEYACLANGVPPYSSAFDACVDHVARALERGEPEMRFRPSLDHSPSPAGPAPALRTKAPG